MRVGPRADSVAGTGNRMTMEPPIRMVWHPEVVPLFFGRGHPLSPIENDPLHPFNPFAPHLPRAGSQGIAASRTFLIGIPKAKPANRLSYFPIQSDPSFPP